MRRGPSNYKYEKVFLIIFNYLIMKEKTYQTNPQTKRKEFLKYQMTY